MYRGCVDPNRSGPSVWGIAVKVEFLEVGSTRDQGTVKLETARGLIFVTAVYNSETKCGFAADVGTQAARDLNTWWFIS